MSKMFFFTSLFASTLLLVGAAKSMPRPQQKPPHPAHFYYLESWQGQPGKADKSDHAPVGDRSTIACVEVTPRQEGSECVLRFENGGTYNLKFRDAITAKNDVVYLTCKASVAQRSCKVQVLTPDSE
jgi:hypothetical protein